MSGKNLYTATQFIAAIPGSGGIISTIAKRIGCDWRTAKKYVEEYTTVKAAYDAECEGVLDLAESVLINNIKLAIKQQQDTSEPVDTGDAKWLLSRKGKQRGYVERQEQHVTGEIKTPVQFVDVIRPETDG